MDTYSETEAQLQTILTIVEAVAYLALVVWFVNRGRGGARWALLGAGGAALVGVALGISAAAIAEVQFLDSSYLVEHVLFRQHTSTVFIVARVAGVVLLGTGIVASRRTPPAPTGSIYGG